MLTWHTDAPESEDDFGTHTVCVVGRTGRGDLRKASVPEGVANRQCGRWLAAGYVVAQTPAELAGLVARGVATLTEGGGGG